MALWDNIMHALAVAPQDHPPVQTRSVSTLEDFRVRLQGSRITPYRLASVTEAMSVPHIFAAVTMLSNIAGSLTLGAFRRGEALDDEERPSLIVRPNPFAIPREWGRETVWSMAAYGEAWWWTPTRDGDDNVMSVIPVNPREVNVTENPSDPMRPLVDWRGRRLIYGREIHQLKMTGEPGALRGKGPLQMCGAAVSVSVEAQEWAANFFAEDGGIPSIVIKRNGTVTKAEAESFLDQWMSKAHNQPRVIDDGVESVDEFGVNQQGAQMLQARSYQNGETAVMFNIPGSLLDHVVAGASLTYQNVGQEFTKLVRQCLAPNYLEPIEQKMSDFLPRSTVTRFDLAGFLRADIKTQYEVATLGLEKGVHDREEARAIVGLAPSIENAAVPFSPPQAVPSPVQLVARSAPESSELRCSNCDKFHMELATRPYRWTCPRCKTVNAAA